MNNQLNPIDFKNELIRILSFWSTNMVDENYGGFYGKIDGQNNLHKNAEKGVVLNSRILWTFSAAFQTEPNPEYEKLANRAFNYIVDHFIDQEYGGVYWLVDFKGNPLETKKQVYAQSFAIYGLTEYYKITHDPKALSISKDLFERIEKYSFESTQNGYLEALSREWEFLDDVRLSEKDLNAQKTMNTHLHILEAYTNLYRVWKDEGLRIKLKNLVDLMLDLFVSSDGHFHLFFDENCNLLSDEHSYGHDIEGSWLLYEAAELLGDQQLLKRVEKVVLDMVNAALVGMDVDGGLMNEGRQEDVIDTDKHWWPQAETLVGLVNAWQLTKNEKYLLQASKTWIFIKNNMIDVENGEWYWKVSKEGVIDTKEDKAGIWKCPYHNGRAMIECAIRLKG